MQQGHPDAVAGRLRMDSMSSADHYQAPMFTGPLGRCHSYAADPFDEQIAGIAKLPGQRGIEDVGGSQPLVDPAPSWTDMGGHFLKKSENIMPSASLISLNLAQVELRPPANRAGILGGDDFFSGHALAGQDFNLQPAAEFGFLCPYSGHRRAGVAGNHGTCRVLILNPFFKDSVALIASFLGKTNAS